MQVKVIHCSLMIEKSRISSIKDVSVLRLELTAATLSINMSNLIKKELDIEDYEETYWTDNKVTLSYISNEVKCLNEVFVANRVQTINKRSKDNPVKDGSRGLEAT